MRGRVGLRSKSLHMVMRRVLRADGDAVFGPTIEKATVLLRPWYLRCWSELFCSDIGFSFVCTFSGKQNQTASQSLLRSTIYVYTLNTSGLPTFQRFEQILIRTERFLNVTFKVTTNISLFASMFLFFHRRQRRPTDTHGKRSIHIDWHHQRWLWLRRRSSARHLSQRTENIEMDSTSNQSHGDEWNLKLIFLV